MVLYSVQGGSSELSVIHDTNQNFEKFELGYYDRMFEFLIN